MLRGRLPGALRNRVDVIMQCNTIQYNIIYVPASAIYTYVKYTIVLGRAPGALRNRVDVTEEGYRSYPAFKCCYTPITLDCDNYHTCFTLEGYRSYPGFKCEMMVAAAGWRLFLLVRLFLCLFLIHLSLFLL